METKRYCPVCYGEVRYYTTTNSGLWKHVYPYMAQIPRAHDVNTYAPTNLLTESKG